ncbi:MAG: putative transposase [Candidatus Aldehydirespiratoraceae bacterium]
MNPRFRRATRARGRFPNEQAALKCLDLVVRSLDPNGIGQKRWKPAFDAFTVTFGGRVSRGPKITDHQQ